MRQWAILIGLDNYQMFQPLKCAQQDAQALQQVLIHEVGFPPEQCILFSDTSPAIAGRSTLPTQTNLQTWIEFLTQQCFKPGDTLWFFFSGYGVCSQGRDYLAPLDGDPFAVETTCILMSDIFSRIQAAISPGIPLMLFDMNRSQGTFSNENVGLQTARLAQQLAVPMVSSCQPGQYSRDISGSGHGLFTLALLDALRYHQAATPSTLMRFLSDRIPELGAYYYLPNQRPLALCPPDKFEQPLLRSQFEQEVNGTPPSSTVATPTPSASGAPGSPTPLRSTDFTHPSSIPPSVENSPMAHRNGSGDAQRDSHQPLSSGRPMGAVGSPELNPAVAIAMPPTPVASASPDPRHAVPPLSPPPPPGLASLSGSAPPPGSSPYANSPSSPSGMAYNGQPPPAPVMAVPPAPLPTTNTPVGYAAPPPPTQPTPDPTAIAEPPPNPEPQESSSNLWLVFLALLSLGLIASVLWRNWAQMQAPQPVATPTPTLSPSPNSLPPDPQATAAPGTAPGTPASVATPQPSPVPPVTLSPAPAPAAVDSQAVLQRARILVLSDQATPYRDAIDYTRQIPPADPAYAEAQQDIAAWSQRIYDIAQMRASRQEWETAIMAAALVPSDNPTLYPQAQALIRQWCPAVQGRTDPNNPSLPPAQAICSQVSF